MGLLNSNTLNQWFTQTLPQNARNLWGEIKQAPQDIRQLISPEMNTQVRQQMNKPSTLDRNAAMGMAMDYLQTTNPMGGLLAHTVYHGSPHKFNKFDMSKIGTGEGAQAYGHGLYFAESPEVAKQYQPDALGYVRLGNGEMLLAQNMTKAQKKAALREIYDSKPSKLFKDKGGIRAYSGNGYLPKEGSMYKVDIPDEAIPSMLDWDKPLSEQADSIKNAVYEYGKKRQIPQQSLDTWRGEQIYENIGGVRNPDLAQQTLKEMGIPGIRYLDGSSRNVGEGTSNFVLFDDQLPRILEINGQPTGLLSYADEAKKAQESSGLLGRYGAKSDDVADELAKERALRVSSIEDDYRLPSLHNAVPKEYLPKQYGKKTVTVYRGVPSSVKDATIRPGDWVSLDKKYAAQHGTGETGKSKVISMEVPAESVGWAGTDMNEWFYVPKD